MAKVLATLMTMAMEWASAMDRSHGLRHGHEQLNAATHWRRNVKFRKTGRGIEIDTTALTRTLLQKVT